MADDVFDIVGSVIGGVYHVERSVAQGHSSVIYCAEHATSHAQVALKCFRIGPRGRDEHQRFLEQFREDAELLSRLSANVTAVVRPLSVDAFTANDGSFVPFVVFEWLEGETLATIVRRRSVQRQVPLELRALIRLLTPVARALERAKDFVGSEGAVSIVHRDLKPANIFVVRKGSEETVKILDFGIGRIKPAPTAGRPHDGGTTPASFTPAYAAPEQWVPKRFGSTGPWTDVWGLALTMVEALAGRAIIQGDQATMMGICLDSARRPTPRQVGVDVPSAVEAAFEHALALDPRERAPHAGVFWDELARALGPPKQELQRSARRDSRVEPEGAARVDAIELGSPSGSGILPRNNAPGLAQQRSVAIGLKLDSIPAPVRSSSISGTRPALDPVFAVPDLEIALPAASTRGRPPSAAQPAAVVAATPASASLDFDETSDQEAMLDLDLPQDDPIVRRSQSSAMLRAVQAPRQASSSTVAAQPNSTPQPNQVSAGQVRVPSTPPRALTPTRGLSAGRGASPVPGPIPGRTASTPGMRAVVPVIASPVREEQSLARRFAPAVSLVGAAVLLTIIDQVYSATNGAVLTIAGVRPSWLAGLLFLVGVGFCVRALARSPD